jgi:hypothetical protein
VENAQNLHLELSAQLLHELQTLAEQENITVEQIVLTAIREKVSILTRENYIHTRAERSNRAAFEEALGSVFLRGAEGWDKL